MWKTNFTCRSPWLPDTKGVGQSDWGFFSRHAMGRGRAPWAHRFRTPMQIDLLYQELEVTPCLPLKLACPGFETI